MLTCIHTLFLCLFLYPLSASNLAIMSSTSASERDTQSHQRVGGWKKGEVCVRGKGGRRTCSLRLGHGGRSDSCRKDREIHTESDRAR